MSKTRGGGSKIARHAWRILCSAVPLALILTMTVVVPPIAIAQEGPTGPTTGSATGPSGASGPSGATASLGEPTIASDQADYNPGATVTLTGTDWQGDTTVHINVNDSIGKTWERNVDVTVAEDGTITDTFDLPLHFVAVYDVTATGLETDRVATTTFTDSTFDFVQCQNDSDKNGTKDDCAWGNGAINATDSIYREGDAIPQRWAGQIDVAGPHFVDFEVDFTKSDVYAYDFITNPQMTQDSDALLAPCQNMAAFIGATDCGTAYSNKLTPIIQQDTFDDVPAHSYPNPRTLYIGSTGGLSLVSVTMLPHIPATNCFQDCGDSSFKFRVTFTTDAANQKVLIWFAGHIASAFDPDGAAGNPIGWGSNGECGGDDCGGSSVSGSPYHIANDSFDGGSIPRKENQVSAGAVPEPGTITIVKDAIPNSAQDFTYTDDIPNCTVGPLDDDADPGASNTVTCSNVAAGTYTVTESDPTPYALTNLDCDDTNSTQTGNAAALAARTATIVLAEGESVICTFTNTRGASLTIVKEGTPEGSTEFDFDGGGTGVSTDFDLVDDGAGPGDNDAVFTFNANQLGVKTVTENVPLGWDLTSVNCLGGTDTDVDVADISVDIAAGDNVTCTFNNSQDATLTIIKQATPEGSTEFDFDGGGTGVSTDFDLVDDGVGPGDNDVVFTFNANQLGVKTVTENVPLGWTLTSATCVGGTDTDVDVADISVDIAAGDNVTCTFNNSQDATLTIIKQATPEGSTEFDFDGGGTGVSTDFDLVDDGAGPGDNDVVFTFNANQLGVKTVTENVPLGWTLTSATCVGGTDTDVDVADISVDIAAGDNVTCTFNNSQDATLTIIKQATPEGSTEFDFDGGGTGVSTDFDLVDDGAGPGDNDVVFTFNANQLGVKTVTENVPLGWTLTSATCVGGTDTDVDVADISVDIAAGDNVTCTFNNSQDATLTIIKQATPEGSTEFDFDGGGTGVSTDFDLVDDGVGPGDNDVVFTFNANQLGVKTVTENVPLGWTLTSATCVGGTDTDVDVADISVDIAAGDNVTCTFNNSQDATLTIIKQATPEGSTEFDFDGGGTGVSTDFDLVDDGAGPGDNDAVFTFNANQLGVKTVTENVPLGWTLTSATCVGGTDTDVDVADISVDIAAGDNVTCTFNNSQDATLTIIKQATPEGSTEFDFDGGGTGVSTDFDLVDDGAGPGDNDAVFTFNANQLGVKTVTENVPLGWTLTSATCVGGTDTDVDVADISVDIAAGDNVTCTFNNSQDATLTIIKQATPEGSTEFDFDGGGTGVSTDFDLVDDGAGPGDNDVVFTFNANQLGVKTVTENVPLGWTLTSATCVGGTDTDVDVADISVDIAAGDNVTCTFNNSQDATLTIIKQATPEGSTEFDFDGGGTGVSTDFDLVDDGVGPGDNDVVFTFNANQLGVKTVTENVPLGWTLTSATCVGGTDTDVDVADISVDIAAGDNVTCTFNNSQDATLTIIKQATPEGSTEFDFDGGGTGVSTDFDLVDDGAGPGDNDVVFTFNANQLGVKTVTENVPLGWTLTSATCVGGTDTDVDVADISVDIAAGDNVTCTFNNSQDATLTIIKQATPEGSTEFDFDGGGTGVSTDFDLVDDGAGPGDNDAVFTFNANQLGVKTVTENVPLGWDLTSVNCLGGTDTDVDVADISVDIAAGDNVTCTFNNTERGTISVEKLLDGAPDPATPPAEFDFELRTGVDLNDPADPLDDDPGQVVPGSATTIAADGVAVQLDGPLVPGLYTLCEIVMPGFTATFDGGSGYTLVDNLSNERLCIDVQVDAGEEVVVEVDNISPPGGEQRTIGFWKNWTSCDGNGNQEAILDQTLIAAGGSILVGDLPVDTCQEAVNILNKSTTPGGQKKASDPAFNLAAQYLAARLNQEADAEVCDEAQDAMDAAQIALAAFDFNGTKTMTKQQIKTLGPSFNALAKTLDEYNNGLLC